MLCDNGGRQTAFVSLLPGPWTPARPTKSINKEEAIVNKESSCFAVFRSWISDVALKYCSSVACYILVPNGSFWLAGQ